MLAAGDHANIVSRKRQFDREIATDSAGTEDTDLHHCSRFDVGNLEHLNRVSARLRRAAMTMLNGAKYRIKDQNVYSAANVADGSSASFRHQKQVRLCPSFDMTIRAPTCRNGPLASMRHCSKMLQSDR